nr:hypothetical protein [Pseudomonas fuscovaginae]
MDTLRQQWQQQARQDNRPLSEHLQQVLAQSPEHLADVAALLGLMPLTDAQLEGHARFDTLPLPQALARQTLPVEIDGQGYLVLGAPVLPECPPMAAGPCRTGADGPGDESARGSRGAVEKTPRPASG